MVPVKEKAKGLKMGKSRILGALAGFACLAACVTGQEGAPSPPEPGVFNPTRDGPDGAPPGSCWGRTVSPAVVQSVTEQEQVSPARVNPDGTIAELPVFRSVTRQQIVRERVDNWFETPCAEVQDAEFISSLQRALSARGFYGAAINGQMTDATRTAIRAYQVSIKAPSSPVLSLEAAQKLGLVAVALPAE